MAEYRNNGAFSNSKTRTLGFKSPSSHDVPDAKILKKKYEKQAEELERQKQRSRELEQIIAETSKKLQKQQRQLAKKEEIEDVLVQQINQLKAELDWSRSVKTASKENSLEEKAQKGKRSFDYINNNSSHSNSEFSISAKNESRVNGYNFTLSDLNGGSSNICQSDDLHQYSNSGIKSYEGQNHGSQSTSSAKVGGYFASIFSN